MIKHGIWSKQMNAWKSLAILVYLMPLILAGCVDDSPVKYNNYTINNINPPVDRSVSTDEKKVHIGHDLPVNVSINADYDEKNVPIQFYLLHVNDVSEVEKGIGKVGDIRMYYIDRTDFTTITQVSAGTHSYGLVINIPSEDAKDVLTGDFKVGPFYVVAEVNKNEDAEIDAFEVYRKFKERLNPDNVITVTSNYLKKPDLSIESLSFTGGVDEPNDVLVFYNLYLKNLPGGENLPTFYVAPSQTDRTFTGTAQVRSSASDALNVPIRFSIENEDGSISVPLEIFDKGMGGYVDMFYIPILKANTTERITVGLRIPEDKGEINYFSPTNYDNFASELNKADYPLSQIRHGMAKEGYRTYNWKIVAEVNPGGTITESRFIEPRDAGEYTEADYYENGDEYSASNQTPQISKNNNTKTESITLALERLEVQANQGIKAYPYSALEPPDDDYRSLVIFWDGIGFNVGGSAFGAAANVHEGMLFYNYSLYSLGVDVHGTIFGKTLYLVNSYLNAESHPFDPLKSGFAFHIEGGGKTVLSESGQGFSENNWELPVLLFSAEYEKEYWYLCFKFKLIAGIQSYFTPGINLNVVADGSLFVQKYATLTGSVYADASASIAGLATIGLYTFIDVITLELLQNTYTVTQFDEVNFPGKIKGSLNRNVGLYIIGPKGYLDIYFEIDFVVFSKRFSKQLFSFSSFRIPLLEEDFKGSGESTTWIQVDDASMIKYNTPE
jgi:hypothetical protein